MTILEASTLAGVVLALAGGIYFGLMRMKVAKSNGASEHRDRFVISDLCAERHKSLETELRGIREAINEIKLDVKDLALRVRTGEVSREVAETTVRAMMERLNIKDKS